MIRIVANWFLNALALYLVTYIVPGVRVDGFGAALWAIIIISFLNAIIRPVLIILTLPITILTLGLFVFIINALLLLLAGSITPGFHVYGLGSALIGSIVLTLITMLFQRLVK